jgi:hypothetical protein
MWQAPRPAGKTARRPSVKPSFAHLAGLSFSAPDAENDLPDPKIQRGWDQAYAAVADPIAARRRREAAARPETGMDRAVRKIAGERWSGSSWKPHKAP